MYKSSLRNCQWYQKPKPNVNSGMLKVLTLSMKVLALPPPIVSILIIYIIIFIDYYYPYRQYRNMARWTPLLILNQFILYSIGSMMSLKVHCKLLARINIPCKAIFYENRQNIYSIKIDRIYKTSINIQVD